MKVGVIGAGTMGSGIAQAFAQTDGYEVYLCDISKEFAEGVVIGYKNYNPGEKLEYGSEVTIVISKGSV